MTKEQKKRIARAGKLGRKYELVYHGCGQCTLAALQDVYGRNSEGDKAVFKACSEFRAGWRRKQTESAGATQAEWPF